MTHDEEGLVDDLLNVDSGLTAWEIDFIENIDARWREKLLTEKQHDRLNAIAEKVGLGGLARGQ